MSSSFQLVGIDHEPFQSLFDLSAVAGRRAAMSGRSTLNRRLALVTTRPHLRQLRACRSTV